MQNEKEYQEQVKREKYYAWEYLAAQLHEVILVRSLGRSAGLLFRAREDLYDSAGGNWHRPIAEGDEG